MGSFVMPALGADMDSGTLLEWRVRPGDTVRRGDIVAVVQTVKSGVSKAGCFAAAGSSVWRGRSNVDRLPKGANASSARSASRWTSGRPKSGRAAVRPASQRL